MHALSILNYTHEEKIDVIYIDPPYNTEKGFLYNDKIVDNNDNYRHSKWLSFMYKRLNLTKKLLTKNGIILISIDDNELSHLNILCNEIFGEENFYTIINWTARNKPMNAGSAKYKIQKSEEYILVYGKNPMKKRIPFKLEENIILKYPHNDKNYGAYRLEEVQQRKNIGIKRSEKMVFSILGISPRMGYRWTIGEDNAKKLVSRNHLLIQQNKIFRKIFKSEENNIRFHPFWANLSDTVGSSESGKAQLDMIIKDHGFETVKPTDLIRKLIFHATNHNSYILDFFAGSGTTGHAVMELNKDDGGKRRFILCTNNENNICTDICYPRLKKVICGYRNEKTDEKIKKLGGGLMYYKIDQIEKEPNSKKSNPPVITDANKYRIITEITDILCVKEWCFDCIYRNKSIASTFVIYKNNNGDYMGIIYDPDSIIKFIKKIDDIQEIKKIHTYVFSNIISSAIRRNTKIKFKSIPTDILNIWNRIFESNIQWKSVK